MIARPFIKLFVLKDYSIFKYLKKIELSCVKLTAFFALKLYQNRTTYQ